LIMWVNSRLFTPRKSTTSTRNRV